MHRLIQGIVASVFSIEPELHAYRIPIKNAVSVTGNALDNWVAGHGGRDLRSAMKAGAQPLSERIEQAVTNFYLRSDGAGGSSTLCFIDAGPIELFRAMPFLGTSPDGVRQQFLSSFNAAEIADALGRAYVEKQTLDLGRPGWFRYLVLSCVIACTGDDLSSYGQFRARLGELYPGRSFSNLSGTAILWKRLANWLTSRRSAGHPFRELKLPGDGGMSQIGLTLRISFPSRPDHERMERTFADNSAISWAVPSTVVRAVNDEIARSNVWSPGFKAAFRDFEARYRTGYRLLAKHPFWLSMQGLRRQDSGKADRLPASITLETDIEGETSFRLSTGNKEVLRAAGFSVDRDSEIAIEITPERVISLLSRTPSLAAFGTLVDCAHEGAIPFEETNVGTWCATRWPSSSYIRLLIRSDLARRWIASKEPSGRWLLTGRMKAGIATSILEVLRPASKPGDEIRSILVEGGIRVGYAYLGREAYLPKISVSTEADVQIEPVDQINGELALGHRAGAILDLSASEPLCGRWRISATEGGQRVGDVSVNFVSAAAEYDFSKLAIDSTRWRKEFEIKQPEHTLPIEPKLTFAFDKASHLSDTEDLLEALYAIGERGVTARQLFDLLAPELKTNVAVWDGIRVLSESGWLAPRASTGWRSQKWFLVPPRLLSFPSVRIVILDGAACDSVRQRFVRCVMQAGGRVEKRTLPNAWSIPVIVGYLESAAGLDEDTGVPFAKYDLRLPSKGPIEFLESAYTARSRTPVSRWSWTFRRFMKGDIADDSGVVLARLEHNGLSSNDIFEIAVSDRPPIRMDTRVAAILRAHQLARKALFRFEPKKRLLLRIGADGALPHPIGDYLRCKHLVNPGLIQNDDGDHKLAYGVEAADLPRLQAWVGVAIETSSEAAAEPEGELEALIVDRRRGIRRSRSRPTQMKSA